MPRDQSIHSGNDRLSSATLVPAIGRRLLGRRDCAEPWTALKYRVALHGFSQSTVSTVSHQCRHHPCSSYAHRRKLTLLLPDPLRRCRKRRRPIAAAPGQQRPGNARHLIGNCHRHDPERSAFEKSCDRRILLRLVARPLQHRMGSDHQNASQILVASFRDRPELLFAASRNLAAVQFRSRLQSRDPIEIPSGPGQWRRWRSHPQCQSQECS